MHDRRAPRSRPTRDPGTFRPVTVAGRGDPLLPGVLLVSALALVVAFVKPWGGGLAGPTGLVQAPPTPTPVESSPSGPDTARAEMATMCVGAGAWLVASEERVSGTAVRIWRAVAPAAAAPAAASPAAAVLPDDPAVPWVPIASESLGALGWCAPEQGEGRLVDPTTLTVSSVTGAAVRPLALLRLRPTIEASSLGGLYRPALAPTPLSPIAAWPAGRYLFHVRSGDGTVFTFGVEVEIVPPLRARPGRHVAAGRRLSAPGAGPLRGRRRRATSTPTVGRPLRFSDGSSFWRSNPYVLPRTRLAVGRERHARLGVYRRRDAGCQRRHRRPHPPPQPRVQSRAPRRRPPPQPRRPRSRAACSTRS